MESRQVRAETEKFVFWQNRFDTRKDCIFFQPNVVVKQLPQRDQPVFSKPVRVEHFPEVLHARPDLRVVRQHAHHIGVFIQTHMPAIGRQELFFLFAKVDLPALLPEAQERLRGLPQPRGPFVCGRS